jgi:hypothetical protein
MKDSAPVYTAGDVAALLHWSPKTASRYLAELEASGYALAHDAHGWRVVARSEWEDVAPRLIALRAAREAAGNAGRTKNLGPHALPKHAR